MLAALRIVDPQSKIADNVRLDKNAKLADSSDKTSQHERVSIISVRGRTISELDKKPVGTRLAE